MHRGKTSIVLGGETYTVKYDWDALAKLRKLFGEEYTAEVLKAVSTENVEALAQIIAVGTGGAITDKKVMKLSPPLHVVIEAVRVGFNVAYTGQEEPPENPTRAGVMKRLWDQLTSLLPHKKQPILEA